MVGLRVYLGNGFLNQAWKTPCGSHTKKIVLVRLADYADDNGLSWPSNQTLCRECDLSERAVRNAIMELEKEGLIKVEWRGGRHLTNRFWIIPQKGAQDAPFIEKGGTANPISGAEKGARHAGNGAPHAPQPSWNHHGTIRGGVPPVFDKELQGRIKLAEEEIEHIKCCGAVSDVDRARIKFLRGKQREWKDTLFNR